MILCNKRETARMQCPRNCHVELQSVSFPDLGGAKVYLCSNCEGAWYPIDSLGAVSNSGVEAVDRSELSVSLVGDKLERVDLKADVACPVCAEKMLRFSYVMAPEVEIDECVEHGTWLDDGELGTIIEKTFASRADMEEYRRKIQESRKEMNIDGIAKGSSALNPFALSLRVLNSLFSRTRH